MPRCDHTSCSTRSTAARIRCAPCGKEKFPVQDVVDLTFLSYKKDRTDGVNMLLTGSTDRRFSNHSAGARIAKIFDEGICLRNTFFLVVRNPENRPAP